MKAIIGKKIGMTHIFDSKGNFIPVTVIEAGPCTVTQVKTVEKDGYSALQLGFGEAKKLNKPEAGHLGKLGIIKNLREFRNTADIEDENSELKVGDTLEADLFSEGDMITVEGISKGKGFAGTIKRHNFQRGPKTHGSHNYRAPGSIGSMYPQHVVKGRRMAGQMGCDKVTVKNLKVIKVDKEAGILAIRGAVPGPRKSLVLIKG